MYVVGGEVGLFDLFVDGVVVYVGLGWGVLY